MKTINVYFASRGDLRNAYVTVNVKSAQGVGVFPPSAVGTGLEQGDVVVVRVHDQRRKVLVPFKVNRADGTTAAAHWPACLLSGRRLRNWTEVSRVKAEFVTSFR